MTTSSPQPTSHRDRAKAKRREAIRRAGMRLFAERGYDGATIADIAEAAEVAPRTVQMYFPSKHDIALSVPNEVSSRLTATFQAHPRAGFLEVVDVWLTGEISALDPELVALATAMYQANPDLRALGSSQITDAMRLGGAALVQETGLPPEHPMTAVVGAALGAAIGEYLNAVQQSGTASELHAAFMGFLRALIGAAARPAPPNSDG